MTAPGPSSFAVRSSRDGGELTLVVTGDLDHATSHRLPEAVHESAEAEGAPERVVVDLSAVSFIDSTGLGALIRVQQDLTGEGGGTTVLRGLAPKFRRLLEMTGLDRDLIVETGGTGGTGETGGTDQPG